MKKTLTALLAACLMSASYGEETTSTGTTITIDRNSSGNIHVAHGDNDSIFVYDVTESATVADIAPSSNVAGIKKVTLQIAEGQTLTVTGYVGLNNKANTDFSGIVTLGNNATLKITNSLQFNCVNVNSSYSTTGAITLGQGATISASYLNFVSGQTNQSLSITGIFGEAQMAELTADNGVQSKLLTTDLITLTQGVKNMTVNSTTVTLGNIKGLDDLGYSNVGLITSVDQLEVGEYGLLYSTSGFQLAGKIIPEPATATLSLLALAGLAARRRRK